MMTSRSSGSLLAALLLGLLCRLAVADSGEAAFQRHYARSRALFSAQKYEACITELKAAYKLRQLPRLLLNMGQAYRKLGRAREALAHYELYLQVDPDPRPEVREEVIGYIEKTRAMLAAAEPGAGAAMSPQGESEHPRPGLLPQPPQKNQADEAVRPLPPAGPASRPQRRPGQPVYKKWWFWTALSGVLATGITAGVVAATLPGDQGSAPPTMGEVF
jgi:tetratricopeptide (TPR) repeat protein